jgi:hypothetical protein
MNPPNRLGTVSFCSKFFRQFVQPTPMTIRLDVLERLPIDAFRSAVLPAKTIGVLEHIRSIHLVVQRIEAIVGRSLRFGMQRRL